MSSRLPSFNRRTFIVGAGALGAAAVGGFVLKDQLSDDGATGDRILGAAFADGFNSDAVLVSGIEQRAPLVLFDADAGRPLRDNPPASIDVELWFNNARVTKLKLNVHDDEISTPYYPLTTTLREPGEYEVRAGFSELPVRFKAVARDKVQLIQVGDAIRSVDTPTATNALGVTPICTRVPNPCSLHTTSLAEVLKTKGPTALLISTPGFCQTAVCGPVLELLLSEKANFPAIRMVHAEVYVDPQEFAQGKPNPRTTPAVTTYGMTYEPSLIVANAEGVVTSRLDFTWDRAELKTALQKAGGA